MREVSAKAGVSARSAMTLMPTNFFKITAPLIIKPLAPLLVSAFAFNFNNFVLIALLTDGRPDFLSTKLPAGQTDILVSYTYRIAFRDYREALRFEQGVASTRDIFQASLRDLPGLYGPIEAALVTSDASIALHAA